MASQNQNRSLKKAFNAVDKAKANLEATTLALKTELALYAARNGLKAIPRPETVRAQL